MLNKGDFFGPLRCYGCGNAIKNVAYQESGDEDHIYCTKCWTVKAKEVAHRRECEKIKAECMKTSNAGVKAECFKALKTLRCSSEYYKGCEERKSKEVEKSGKLGAIIRELNKRYDVLLKAFEEDKHERAKNISLYICINNSYTKGDKNNG